MFNHFQIEQCPESIPLDIRLNYNIITIDSQTPELYTRAKIPFDKNICCETDGVEIEFTESGIDEIAVISFMMNEQTENIGARRLHTVMEKLLEEISFNVPNPEMTKVVIDSEYVKSKFEDTIASEDLDRYIL